MRQFFQNTSIWDYKVVLSINVRHTRYARERQIVIFPKWPKAIGAIGIASIEYHRSSPGKL